MRTGGVRGAAQIPWQGSYRDSYREQSLIVDFAAALGGQLVDADELKGEIVDLQAGGEIALVLGKSGGIAVFAKNAELLAAADHGRGSVFAQHVLHLVEVNAVSVKLGVAFRAARHVDEPI